MASLLDRASGFYSSLVQKLLCRIPDFAWPTNVFHFFADNAPTNGKTFCDAGRLDVDSLTLKIQQVRFSREEKAGFRNTSHLAAEIESTQQRPTILSRGSRLPNSGDTPICPRTVEAKDSPQIYLSFTDSLSYLLQHCLIHLGDVARYQHQYTVAESYYTWAWLVDPSSGHAYNQLAIIESTRLKRRLDSLCYFYVRAIACSHPFPAAGENLTYTMNTIIAATEDSFSSLFCDYPAISDLCDLLLCPLPLLLRFHSFARNSKDIAAISKAASEFSSATNALAMIVNSDSGSFVLPAPLNERSAKIAAAFASFNLPSDPIESLRRIQVRLMNLVVLHTFGLQSNWSHEDDRNCVRHCLIYTTVSLVNWLFVFVIAIRNKYPHVKDDLPVTPILLMALALNAQCGSKGAASKALSDSEMLEISPPLSKSAVAFLNSLACSTVSSRASAEGLFNAFLPELFALQGFTPMGIPVFNKPLQPGPLGGLTPDSLFNSDLMIQDSALKERTSLLIETFRSVAKKLPSLLRWSDEEEAFLSVDRCAPLSPQPSVFAPGSPLVNEELNHSEPEPRGSKQEEDGNQKSNLSGNLLTPNSDEITEPHETNLNCEICEVAGSHGGEGKENPSVRIPASCDDANKGQSVDVTVNTELARFIQEQACQVAARQHSRMATGAINSTSTNHSYTSSRFNFERDLPPRFLKQEKDALHQSLLNQPAPLALKESEGNLQEQCFHHSQEQRALALEDHHRNGHPKREAGFATLWYHRLHYCRLDHIALAQAGAEALEAINTTPRKQLIANISDLVFITCLPSISLEMFTTLVLLGHYLSDILAG
ncbi:unnamed protein product [Mesocestoides corti]|uniref:DNA/RNA-binding domain-containing protein n=1 Tax=Mesocestoides corti TaxID=53468 RepID=A0A3P6HPU9_MESCO|nr:unnamed protein product [Mesocestoides corti]